MARRASRSKTARRTAQARHRPAPPKPPDSEAARSRARHNPPRSRWAAQAARRRRMARVVVLGVVVVIAAIAVGAYLSRYQDPAAPAAPLPGYHITYEVVDTQNNNSTIRREVTVR